MCDRSAGSSLLLKPKRIEEIARSVSRSMSCPLTLKTRKGYYDDKDVSRAWGSGLRFQGLGFKVPHRAAEKSRV